MSFCRRVSFYYHPCYLHGHFIRALCGLLNIVLFLFSRGLHPRHARRETTPPRPPRTRTQHPPTRPSRSLPSRQFQRCARTPVGPRMDGRHGEGGRLGRLGRRRRLVFRPSSLLSLFLFLCWSVAWSLVVAVYISAGLFRMHSTFLFVFCSCRVVVRYHQYPRPALFFFLFLFFVTMSSHSCTIMTTMQPRIRLPRFTHQALCTVHPHATVHRTNSSR